MIKTNFICQVAWRWKILDKKEIKCLFKVYEIEDGSLIKLDQQLAANHIRQVINDQKRSQSRYVKQNQNVT